MADKFNLRVPLGAAVLALGLSGAAPAAAAEPAPSAPAGAEAQAQRPEPMAAEDAQAVAGEVDTDIGKMRRDLDVLGKSYAAPAPAEINRVDRRLSEGEIQYILKDYLRASIVLLDVVEDPSAKSHPKYDDCVFLLAEALRRSTNHGGARAYYEELLPRASGDRLKDVVLGLLEIASATDRYENVEHYIDRLRQGGTLSRPDVDYIYGKMLFKGATSDPAKLPRAFEVFRSVPEGTSISAQAAYYAGVALVQLGRYPDAIRQFDETLARIPKGADGDRLRELTNLSLGRLYQEVGDVEKSTAAYQTLPQSSPYFPDMLYEVAWAHVRSANQAKDPEARRQSYTRALRAVEVLMATSPSSRLYPQARVLQGNLEIRLGAQETAYDTFQSIIDRYGAARDKLSDVLAGSSDPKQFFDQLIAADRHTVGATTLLPKLALEWALGDDGMRRAVSMTEDLADSRKNLTESQELVAVLTAALAGEQKYGLLPGMQQVRSKALSIENRLVNVNRRLLNLERRLTAPALAAADFAQLERLHGRAAALEAEIQRLPQTEEDVELSKQQVRGQFDETGRRAYRQTYQVASLRAQIVAAEQWANRNSDRLRPEELAAFSERIGQATAEVQALQGELDALQGEIRSASAIAGADGGRGRARQLRDEYAQVLAQEIALLRSLRGSAGGGSAALGSRLDQQRAALQQIDQDLRQLQAALDQQVGRRVDELLAAIAAEAGRIQGYEGQQSELSGLAGGMLGPVATRTLADVGKQLKDFVLQADVGIIDVAWARKQAETKKVNELIKQQQDKTTELEAEFADVLEGQ